MARETGSKTATFSPAEIEALGLSDAEDFGQALREKLAATNDIRLEPDLSEMVKNRAYGIGVSVNDMINAILRKASVQ